ncbi:MAG TPA: hypothetical protein VFA20_09550 [Myxococcaceae bacterium]|nr:hypothetical protein [Myxococcaceae bacterium]
MNKSYRFQAVARDGTALALNLSDSRTRLYASTDGARTWAPRVNHTSAFTMISTLSDGTLIADVPSGELVLQLYNALDFGPGGMGYELLRPIRQ